MISIRTKKGKDKELTIISKGRNYIKRFSTVIGADGPDSIVRRFIGKKDKNAKGRFFMGNQARLKLNHSNQVEVYPFIGHFAWIVPEGRSTVRAGVMGNKNTSKLLDDFLQIRIGKNYRKDIISRQAGMIPVYDHKQRLAYDGCFLVGDAAGQVKATTGGGLVPGLKAAEILADCIINKKDYQKKCNKMINKNLKLHLRIRKMLDKFTKKDYDELIKTIKVPKVRMTIEEFDREEPASYIFRLFIRSPKLIKYLRFLI